MRSQTLRDNGPPGSPPAVNGSASDKDDEFSDDAMPGLHPPTLESGGPVTGSAKKRLRVENKRRRVAAQEAQEPTSFWTEHEGKFSLPATMEPPGEHLGGM